MTDADPRAARCRPDIRRYALLLVELAGLLAVIKLFRIEEYPFLVMTATAAGGFAVHYWLPLRWKEWFWIALSVGGLCLIVEPLAAGLLVACALAFFAIGRAPLPYPARVGGILLLGALFTAGRIFGLPDEPRGVSQLWPLLGAVFMFRLAIWTYDLRHMKTPPSLKEFLAYFLMLPNWACLLFPVVDFHTQRKSFLARDIHVSAQQGIEWMTRGVIQLLLYRLIYYRKPAADPATVTSLAQLLLVMITTYALYLRLSGLFHFVIGVLHLFGYDLPETHRKYFLASSLTDFWRRINIYWKDFMVKLVYFPLYFRLRRRGEIVAQTLATLVVFAVTWALHAWQDLWLKGHYALRGPDVAFWGLLGLFVVVNLQMELRRRKRPAASGAQGRVVHALKVAGTFLLLSTLWSLWNAKTFAQWFDLVTWWQVGR